MAQNTPVERRGINFWDEPSVICVLRRAPGDTSSLIHYAYDTFGH
jgi:hypothetical protein